MECTNETHTPQDPVPRTIPTHVLPTVDFMDARLLPASSSSAAFALMVSSSYVRHLLLNLRLLGPNLRHHPPLYLRFHLLPQLRSLVGAWLRMPVDVYSYQLSRIDVASKSGSRIPRFELRPFCYPPQRNIDKIEDSAASKSAVKEGGNKLCAPAISSSPRPRKPATATQQPDQQQHCASAGASINSPSDTSFKSLNTHLNKSLTPSVQQPRAAAAAAAASSPFGSATNSLTTSAAPGVWRHPNGAEPAL